MTLHTFIGGRSIETVEKLTPEDLERGIKLEEHAHILDRYLNETAADGTYGWQGTLGRGGNLTVPKASLNDKITQEERFHRIKDRLDKIRAGVGGPPLLLSYDTETDTPIFHEDDMEIYKMGWICPGCIQWQSVPNAPECTWLRPSGHDPAPDRDKGCGHVRDFNL